MRKWKSNRWWRISFSPVDCDSCGKIACAGRCNTIVHRKTNRRLCQDCYMEGK